MSGAPAMVEPQQHRGSVVQTVKAVAWAFLGIRKKSAYEQDLARLNPLHVVAVALVAVALLVGGLIALVHWIAG